MRVYKIRTKVVDDLSKKEKEEVINTVDPYEIVNEMNELEMETSANILQAWIILKANLFDIIQKEEEDADKKEAKEEEDDDDDGSSAYDVKEWDKE